MTDVARTPTRRDEYAQATREAIIAAARRLFAERGYFATKVDDIAAAARVAPATVYAVTGGKRGLFAELVRRWSTDPLVELTISTIESLTDPVEIVGEVASVTRRMREEFGDVIRFALTTAPHDRGAAEQVEKATSVYRGAFLPIAEHLIQLGALRPGMDTAGAVDVLWFYFGYASYFVLCEDNHWSYDRAEQWLADQAVNQLLSGAGHHATPPGRP